MRASKKRYFGYEAVLGTIKAGKSSHSRFLCDLAFSLGPLLVDRFSLQHREWVKNQLELQLQVLTKNLRFIDRKVEIESGLEKAQAELKGLESVLLSGDTSSVSASNIQEAVQVFADKEGIQIITTRVLNPEVMGPFTKIPIQLELSGQIDQLANFIKGIEATKSLLIVNELDARSLYSAAVIARQISVGQTPYRLCVPASLSQASLVFRQLHPRNSSQLH